MGGLIPRSYSHEQGGILRLDWRNPPRPPSKSPATLALVPSLFHKRLLFITGKGGVGKSTTAIALGLVAARQGLRTVVAELASQERAQRLFEQNGNRFTELRLADNLFTISIDPQHAMEEYLRVKVGAVGQALSSSRLFSAFAMATPGMRELLSIGKVWELAQFERRTRGGSPYDLVIVDAPATGHGVALLRTPSTFAGIARVGPIAHQARTIAATIADRQVTGIVAVATAEEMPVNETIALGQSLIQDGLDLDTVIVNGLYPPHFQDDEMSVLADALGRARSPRTRSALRAAASEHARARTQQRQLERLRTEFNGRLLSLPYVFAEQLGPDQMNHLADALAGQVGSPPEDAS